MRLAPLLRPKRLLPILAGVVIIAALILWSVSGKRAPASQFNTAPVQRGDLIATVTATGTIEPEEVIDVGAQVVGIIQEFGADPSDYHRPIDFGSYVEEGTVLARIDDTVYKARLDRATAQVEQARAQVAQAAANLRRSEADALQSQAKHNQAARDWDRAQRLVKTGAVSQEDYDARRASYEVTKADLAVAEAAIAQAKAAQQAAEKTLGAAEADQREARRNLDYTVIRSPVKGVIIDRRVNVGQTVVSSLNAPSLFLIAKDLTRLQVWASVNEADIARIRTGMPVRFKVDARPTDEFAGTVTQIRLNATMTQNVVTYTVVVTADNREGKLLPYLTASLRFETGRRNNVLMVPNAALRWQPAGQSAGPPLADRGTVWVLEGGQLRAVDVETGMTDGLATEIVAGDLHEGQQVVVSQAVRAEAGGAANPFTPNMFGGKKK